MVRLFGVLMGVLGAGVLAAQQVSVSLSPQEIWQGDAFQLEVKADEPIATIEPTFSMPVKFAGGLSGSVTVNGRTTFSRGQHVVPGEVGICRLEGLRVILESGKVVTAAERPSVAVRQLEADPDVAITMTAEPHELMPGDTLTLTVEVSASPLKLNGGTLSPFMREDFFRGVVPAAPTLRMPIEEGDEEAVVQTARGTVSGPTQEHGKFVWRYTFPFRAARVGERTFAAPVLNDTRYAIVDGRLQGRKCVAIGKPLTVQVTEPPLEGRPAGYVGAYGARFEAMAALDAHNVALGDPIRLTLTLRADCDPAFLRPLSLGELPGFRVVGEPERKQDSTGVSFAYTLRPTRVGLLELPPLTLAWFNRPEKRYETCATGALPVRVRVGEAQSLAAPPPALTRDFTEPTRPTLPWWVLGAGVLALAVRLTVRPLRALFRLAAKPFRANRPLAQARAVLARTRDAAEAAAAVRRWAGRPSLTPEELRRRLEPSPEADAVVAAYAALEGAAYSGGGDAPEARKTLRDLLPKVRRLAVLLLCLVPLLGAAADDFGRDRAWAASLNADTPEALAAATDRWLGLIRAGDDAPATLRNAAACAQAAGRPDVSLALLRRCERAHGRSEEGDAAMRAACAALARPMPSPFARVAWWQAAGWAAMALGLCALLCAVPWRALRVWRAAALVAALILAAWAGAVWTAVRHGAVPEDLAATQQEVTR